MHSGSFDVKQPVQVTQQRRAPLLAQEIGHNRDPGNVIRMHKRFQISISVRSSSTWYLIVADIDASGSCTDALYAIGEPLGER